MKRTISLFLILLGFSMYTQTVTVTSEAGTEFRITRLQLYFENRRAEITIKKDLPSLKAYADIRFTGSGLLQGFWEVDGRILKNVNRHIITSDRSITIETPEAPPLPTFETSTHRIRFIITNPLQDISFPEAIYFVTAEKSKEIFPVNLLYPDNNSEVDYSPLTFRWETEEKTVTYLIVFFKEEDEKPIFSAYTRNAEYKLPPSVLKNIFISGESYLWRVKGFDTKGSKAGESPLYRFTFK